MNATIDLEGKTVPAHTFGGEARVDGWDEDRYGIDLHDVTIHDIPSETFAALACQMVDHLIANGHRFAFEKSQLVHRKGGGE